MCVSKCLPYCARVCLNGSIMIFFLYRDGSAFTCAESRRARRHPPCLHRRLCWPGTAQAPGRPPSRPWTPVRCSSTGSPSTLMILYKYGRHGQGGRHNTKPRCPPHLYRWIERIPGAWPPGATACMCFAARGAWAHRGDDLALDDRLVGLLAALLHLRLGSCSTVCIQSNQIKSRSCELHVRLYSTRSLY